MKTILWHCMYWLSVSSTCLSFDPDLQILACPQHYMWDKPIILTFGPAQVWWGLPTGQYGGVGLPSNETWGQMVETLTPPAATHRQKTALQLWVEDQDHIRRHSGGELMALKYLGRRLESGAMLFWLVYLTNPSSSSNHTLPHWAVKTTMPHHCNDCIWSLQRTFIQILEVLDELLLSRFLVEFLLNNVSSVLDVVTDWHLLQTTLRIFNCSPGLCDLVIQQQYDVRKYKTMRKSCSGDHWRRRTESESSTDIFSSMSPVYGTMLQCTVV